MEDNIQTIIVAIISVFLLFIFPVYLAYEKKDDISYALAMRYTQDLVDEVRSKGYITKDMYDDYQARLKVTGNSYDISLTHEYVRYDPVTNYYMQNRSEDGKKINYTLIKTSTQKEREELENKWKAEIGNESNSDIIKEYITSKYSSQGIDKIEDSYEQETEVFTTDNILGVLKAENKLELNKDIEVVNEDLLYTNAYVMNVGDTFTISIKNTNTTLATVIYNMVTANILDSNTRIYVNYGGEILASKWYGKVDYAKLYQEHIKLNSYEALNILDADGNRIDGNNFKSEKAKIIEFEVKPEKTTDLIEKGKINSNLNAYNFALGNNKTNSEDTSLSVSVGINGISLIASNAKRQTTDIINSINLPEYKVEKTCKEQYQELVNKTCKDTETYTYIDDQTGEEKQGTREKEYDCSYYETKEREKDCSYYDQRYVSDYTLLSFSQTENGKVMVTGRLNGESKTVGVIELIDKNNLLSNFERTIKNPRDGVIDSWTAGNKVTPRGTNVNYSIYLTSTNISLSANRTDVYEKTILSYPVSIDGFVRVKIEFKENEDSTESTKTYIAELYIDDEKVAESAKLSSVPMINEIGKTVIGSDESSAFKGNIRNLVVYY